MYKTLFKMTMEYIKTKSNSKILLKTVKASQ